VVCSAIPGRIRTFLPALRGDAVLAQNLEREVRAVAGVIFCRANPLTGRLLVVYEPPRLSGDPSEKGLPDCLKMLAAALPRPPAAAPRAANIRPTKAPPARSLLATASGQALVVTATAGLLTGTALVRSAGYRRPVPGYPSGLFLAQAAVGLLSGYPVLRTAVMGLPRLGVLSGPLLLTLASLILAGWRGSLTGLLLSLVLAISTFTHASLNSKARQEARARAARLRRAQGLALCPTSDPAISAAPAAAAKEWLQLPSDLPELETYARRMSVAAFAAAGLAYLFTRNPQVGLAILLAANPRVAYTAATTMLAAAMDVLSGRGVVVRQHEALPRLARLEAVWLDGPGVLVEEEARVGEVLVFQAGWTASEVRAYGYALVRETGTPLARALANALGEERAAVRQMAVRWSAGTRGVRGTIDGDEFLVGSLGYLRSRGVSTRVATTQAAKHDLLGHQVFGFARRGVLIGLIALETPALPGALEAVERIRALGYPEVGTLDRECPGAVRENLNLRMRGANEPARQALVVVQRGAQTRAVEEAFLSLATPEAACDVVERASLLSTASWMDDLPALLAFGQAMREVTRQNVLLAAAGGLVGMLLVIGGRLSCAGALSLNEVVNLLVAWNANRLLAHPAGTRGPGHPRSTGPGRGGREQPAVEECAAGRESTAIAPVPEVLGDLGMGLAPEEAARRVARYGRNELQQQPVPGWGALFLGQFRSSATQTLLGAGVVAALLGHLTDTLTIGAILVLNAALGASQEYRAERSLEAMRNLAAPRARVVRSGSVYEIRAADLAPGDLVLLTPGDRVPADAVLVEAEDLWAEESSLTGEAEPVHKMAIPGGGSPDHLPKSDRGLESPYRVFLGTGIVRGRGLALVTATGMRTEMGQMVSLIQKGGPAATLLQARYDRLTRLLVQGSLGVGLLVGLMGLARGQGTALELAMTGLSIAVAAIPEGLPAIVSVALATGVQRMARKGALVRRLSAMETLGRVTVVCSDKTGTITQNRLAVRRLWAAGRAFTLDELAARPGEEDARWALVVAVCCNDGQRDGQGEFTGDGIDVALLEAGARAGLNPESVGELFRRTHSLPFESERGYMVTLCNGSDGSRYLFVKGAPERVLGFCTRYGRRGAERPLDLAARAVIVEEAERMASEALRLVAVAYQKTGERAAAPPLLEAEPGDLELTFGGLIALTDRPREGVKQAVAECRRRGIRVIMITGDHPKTARAVARAVGILDGDGLTATGSQIETLSDAGLEAIASRVQVFARVRPDHKLRIVEALRRTGQVVVMTGDGVNDSPAVKWADVGFAMGTGTEVTKEASSIVLVDNSFVTILRALEEGGMVHRNIQAAFEFLLAGNFGEVLLMAIAVLSGLPLPLLPLQMLLVNLFTDGLPALGLVLREPGPPPVRQREPGRCSPETDDASLGRRLLCRGGIIGLLATGMYWGALRGGRSLGQARSIAFAGIVAGQFLQFFHWPALGLPRGRCLAEPWVRNLLGLSWTGFLSTMYLPGVSRVFGLTPLGFREWASVLGAAGAGAALAAQLDARLARGAPAPVTGVLGAEGRDTDASHGTESVPERFREWSSDGGRRALPALQGGSAGA
jgi:Ca2+-transporting ATPase